MTFSIGYFFLNSLEKKETRLRKNGFILNQEKIKNINTKQKKKEVFEKRSRKEKIKRQNVYKNKETEIQPIKTKLIEREIDEKLLQDISNKMKENKVEKKKKEKRRTINRDKLLKRLDRKRLSKKEFIKMNGKDIKFSKQKNIEKESNSKQKNNENSQKIKRPFKKENIKKIRPFKKENIRKMRPFKKENKRKKKKTKTNKIKRKKISLKKYKLKANKLYYNMNKFFEDYLFKKKMRKLYFSRNDVSINFKVASYIVAIIREEKDRKKNKLSIRLITGSLFNYLFGIMKNPKDFNIEEQKKFTKELVYNILSDSKGFQEGLKKKYIDFVFDSHYDKLLIYLKTNL
jgi:hypothetical protein